jgi:uncharacterized protein (DUF169 family)
MVSGTDWRSLEQRIAKAIGPPARAVGVAFLDAPPPHTQKFEGSEPSGCSFWRLAAAGRSFYTVPEDHYNCAVGAHTHNIPLSPAREKESAQTLAMMFDLGYVKPEEVEKIPRLAKSPAFVAYAPLRSASFRPDVVLFACKPSAAMLLNEAAARAGIPSGAPALGRPTCMALPASLATGSILSLGCIGNRVYTGLGDDELYFVLRGRDLPALADALEVIATANQALGEYARARREQLASA